MDKNILKSKTFWVSLLTAVAPMFPVVRDVMVANPELAGMVVGGVFAILRLISNGKVYLA